MRRWSASKRIMTIWSSAAGAIAAQAATIEWKKESVLRLTARRSAIGVRTLMSAAMPITAIAFMSEKKVMKTMTMAGDNDHV